MVVQWLKKKLTTISFLRSCCFEAILYVSQMCQYTGWQSFCIPEEEYIFSSWWEVKERKEWTKITFQCVCYFQAPNWGEQSCTTFWVISSMIVLQRIKCYMRHSCGRLGKYLLKNSSGVILWKSLSAKHCPNSIWMKRYVHKWSTWPALSLQGHEFLICISAVRWKDSYTIKTTSINIFFLSLAVSYDFILSLVESSTWDAIGIVSILFNRGERREWGQKSAGESARAWLKQHKRVALLQEHVNLNGHRLTHSCFPFKCKQAVSGYQV